MSATTSPDKNKKKSTAEKLFAEKDMNKNEIVSLLKKNIDELILITEGFNEMETFPAAILNLAKGKTDEIRQYIEKLEISDVNVIKKEVVSEVKPEIIPEIVPEIIPVVEIPQVETETKKPDIQEKIEIIVEEKTSVEITIEETKTKTLGDKLSQHNVSRNDLLSKKENGGIHASIANQKITDIRQAISLGDRFRFQRELFRNNGEEMNKMLTYINMLATYDEAIAFLITKYGWQEDNPAAVDFYQIIKRKF